jgi:hypothetical protein
VERNERQLNFPPINNKKASQQAVFIPKISTILAVDFDRGSHNKNIL